MNDTTGVVGITDAGQPIVVPDFVCDHFELGTYPLLNQRICWYCRFSDFRKTTDILLKQSICRCPANQKTVRSGRKNEMPSP
jgi:hypothetical protein